MVAKLSHRNVFTILLLLHLIQVVFSDESTIAVLDGRVQSVRRWPDVIRDLELILHEDNIEVSWSLKNRSGKVKQYDVQWSTERGEIIDDSYTFVRGYRYTIELEGTQPCSAITVSVHPQSNEYQYIGDPKWKTTNTPAKAPPAPATISCSLNSDGQIVLKWGAPDSRCSISRYAITWKENVLWTDEENEGNSISETGDLSYTLKQATPYTSYKICVAGVVEGRMEGKKDCCDQQTEQAAPSAPRNLQVLDGTNGNATVQWEAPERRNGIITEYTVTWIDNEDTSTRSVHTMKDSPEQLQRPNFDYEIQNLGPNKSYNITVQSKTIKLGAEESRIFRSKEPYSSKIAAHKTEDAEMAGYRSWVIIVPIVVTYVVTAVVALLLYKYKISTMEYTDCPKENVVYCNEA